MVSSIHNNIIICLLCITQSHIVVLVVGDFILTSTVKLPVLLINFLFSPLIYFLLQNPAKSQRKLQKLCTGRVVPTLGHIEARRMGIIEYMLYAWTSWVFSSTLRWCCYAILARLRYLEIIYFPIHVLRQK